MSPRRPPRPCPSPGCGELVREPGPCPSCRRERQRAYDARRRADPAQRERYQFYGSTRWKRLRASVLAAEPLCRSCRAAGRTVPAREVHHISGDWRDSRLENLEPRCERCHRSETMRVLNRRRQR